MKKQANNQKDGRENRFCEVSTDDVLSLYVSSDELEYDPTSYNYNIVLKDNKEYIGYMIVQYTCNNNIVIMIKDEYQGKGYGYHALCLLIDYLLSRGVKNFELFARDDNIPSLKVLSRIHERYGAKEVENGWGETVYRYDFNEKDLSGKRW